MGQKSTVESSEHRPQWRRWVHLLLLWFCDMTAEVTKGEGSGDEMFAYLCLNIVWQSLNRVNNQWINCKYKHPKFLVASLWAMKSITFKWWFLYCKRIEFCDCCVARRRNCKRLPCELGNVFVISQLTIKNHFPFTLNRKVEGRHKIFLFHWQWISEILFECQSNSD